MVWTYQNLDKNKNFLSIHCEISKKFILCTVFHWTLSVVVISILSFSWWYLRNKINRKLKDSLLRKFKTKREKKGRLQVDTAVIVETEQILLCLCNSNVTVSWMKHENRSFCTKVKILCFLSLNWTQLKYCHMLVSIVKQTKNDQTNMHLAIFCSVAVYKKEKKIKSVTCFD